MLNQPYKTVGTIKTLVYGVNPNEILVRVSNLEDRFDRRQARTYNFDLNAFGREFYFEANRHLSSKNASIIHGMKLEITEMNLAGSVNMTYFTKNDTKLINWKTSSQEDPSPPIKKGKDLIKNITLPQLSSPVNETYMIVPLAPQQIRVFSLKFIPPELHSANE